MVYNAFIVKPADVAWTVPAAITNVSLSLYFERKDTHTVALTIKGTYDAAAIVAGTYVNMVGSIPVASLPSWLVPTITGKNVAYGQWQLNPLAPSAAASTTLVTVSGANFIVGSAALGPDSGSTAPATLSINTTTLYFCD